MKDASAKVASAFLLWAFFFSAGCQRQQSGPIELHVGKTVLTEERVRIDYEIVNTSRQSFWVCRDVSIYFPYNEICELDGSTLYVRRRLSAFPEYVEFSEAMIANYVHVNPDSRVDGSVDVLIPETFESYSKYEHGPAFSQITRIILEVGCFDRRLVCSYLNLRNVDDPDDGYYEMGQLVRQRYAVGDTPESLLMPHYWLEIRDEEVLQATLNESSEGWLPQVRKK